VSSFGAGGAIAHALLEQAPVAPDGPDNEVDGSVIVPLSATTAVALAESAANLLEWIRAQREMSLRSLAHTLTRRRSHLPVRAAIVADSIGQVEEGLRAVASNAPAPGIVTGEVDSGDRAEAVWVFSGHGAQWEGMARRLLSREPVFAAVIDSVAEIYREELGFSAREAIEQGDWSSVLRVQAMTFALQVALAEVLRDRGAAPGAVIGHSVGEIAASVVAGVLPVADAARFACRRAALLQRLAGQGSMALVGLPFAEVDRQLAGRSDVVAAIAASAITSVVSGETAAVDEVVNAWEASGIMVRRVASDGAFHSPQIDPIVPELAEAAAGLISSPATVPLYSSALDDPRSPAPRDARYWVSNARRPVLFDQAVRAAVADGHRIFLEVSTHPIVTHSMTETLDSLGIDPPLVAGTLRRGEDEDSMIMAAIGWLHCHGNRIDWNAAGPGGDLLSLPTTPWQHRSYWLQAPSATGRAMRHDPAAHSLLGGRSVVGGESPSRIWQTELDMTTRPYSGEHRVYDAEIVPASVLLNTMLNTDAEKRATRGLRDIRLRVPVQVVPRTVQVLARADGLSLTSRIQGGDDLADGWMVHTTAVFDEAVEPITGKLEDTAAVWARCSDRWPWAKVEDHYRRRGADGFGFPWHVDEVGRGPMELIADLNLTSADESPEPTWACALDAAMSMTPLLMLDDGVLRMPAAIGSVRVQDEPTRQITVHAVVRESAGDTVDLRISDTDGRVIAEVRGLRFGKLEGGSAATRPGQLVYTPQWRPYVWEPAPRPWHEILVISDQAERGEKLAAAFVASGFSSRWAPAIPEQFAEAAVILLLPAIPAPDEPVDQAAEACTWSLISAAKQVAQSSGQTRLWCVTRGVRAAVDRAALAHSPLWGAARIIAGELPHRTRCTPSGGASAERDGGPSGWRCG
jgi:6-methylsalicylic acid synthase